MAVAQPRKSRCSSLSGSPSKISLPPSSCTNALESKASGDTLSDPEILERVDKLRASGRPVLLTRFTETYHLTPYLKRYTDQPIRFAMSLFNLMQVFHEAYYEDLDGGLVEAISRLMSTDVRLYVEPMDVEAVRAQLAALDDES